MALALIVWQKPNLLLLDEPTNHLDLEMRHALTMALQGYEGALVVISHDRHLLRNTVDEFYLVANGTVSEFEGDLKDYQKWLKDFVRYAEVEATETSGAVQDKKTNRKKTAKNREKLAPVTKNIRELETLMNQLESQLKEIQDSLADENIYKDEQKKQLNSVLANQSDVEKRLKICEEHWLESQDQLEALERMQT